MIGVSTITQRRHLHERLARTFPGVRFFTDTQGDATGNYLRALCGAPDLNGWKVVLEDDALPAANLAQALPLILRAAPLDADVVSFYNNHFSPLPTGIQPYTQRMLPTVGLAIRSELVNDLVELAGLLISNWEPQFRNNYDRALMLVLDAFGRGVYVTQPSLVDHDHTVPSALGHPTAPGGRVRVGPNYDPDSVRKILKELYANH